MKARPILFMDSMVAAILDGRKTVTRRVGKTWAGVQPGARLWVREAHCIVDGRCWSGLPCTSVEVLIDPADDGPTRPVWAYYRTGFDRTPPRWRPSIHMPRWACRIELEVVSVTEDPARGCDKPEIELCMCAWSGCVAMPQVDDDEARREGFADRAGFMSAWTAMHAEFVGPVYRVEFRRAS